MKTYKERLEYLGYLEAEANRIEAQKWHRLRDLVLCIQKRRKIDSVEFSDKTNFPEYYSHYSQDTSPILAVRVTKTSVIKMDAEFDTPAWYNNDGLNLEVRVADGNGDEFFDPFADGEIADNIVPFLAKYLEISLEEKN